MARQKSLTCPAWEETKKNWARAKRAANKRRKLGISLPVDKLVDGYTDRFNSDRARQVRVHAEYTGCLGAVQNGN